MRGCTASIKYTWCLVKFTWCLVYFTYVYLFCASDTLGTGGGTNEIRTCTFSCVRQSWGTRGGNTVVVICHFRAALSDRRVVKYGRCRSLNFVAVRGGCSRAAQGSDFLSGGR